MQTSLDAPHVELMALAWLVACVRACVRVCRPLPFHRPYDATYSKGIGVGAAGGALMLKHQGSDIGSNSYEMEGSFDSKWLGWLMTNGSFINNSVLLEGVVATDTDIRTSEGFAFRAKGGGVMIWEGNINFDAAGVEFRGNRAIVSQITSGASFAEGGGLARKEPTFRGRVTLRNGTYFAGAHARGRQPNARDAPCQHLAEGRSFDHLRA